MAQSNHNGTWTLTHAEYQRMLRDVRKLRALEAAGVDGWDGYGEALQSREDPDE